MIYLTDIFSFKTSADPGHLSIALQTAGEVRAALEGGYQSTIHSAEAATAIGEALEIETPSADDGCAQLTNGDSIFIAERIGDAFLYFRATFTQ